MPTDVRKPTNTEVKNQQQPTVCCFSPFMRLKTSHMKENVLFSHEPIPAWLTHTCNSSSSSESTGLKQLRALNGSSHLYREKCSFSANASTAPASTRGTSSLPGSSRVLHITAEGARLLLLFWGVFWFSHLQFPWAAQVTQQHTDRAANSLEGERKPAPFQGFL